MVNLDKHDWIELLSDFNYLANGKMQNGIRFCDCHLRLSTHEEIRLVFDVAWEPCTKFVRSKVKQYPGTTWTLAYCEMGSAFYGVYETIYDEKERRENIMQIDYEFLDDDLIFMRDDDPDYDDPDSTKPNGRLKEFMKDYHIEHMGG